MIAILGISCFYHDSAAALVVDGEIIASAQEERFTRIKHDPRYPKESIDYVLSAGGISLSEVTYVAFYDKPFLKFERLVETYVAEAPKGLRSFLMAIPVWLREKLFLKNHLRRELRKLDAEFDSSQLLFNEHHASHGASAFYPSPYEEAVVLTLDGVGEWATASVAIGRKNSLRAVRELHFPHSLGLFYSAFTYYAGFVVNSGEYKIMGLAPYGEPKYKDLIMNHIIDVKDDGSFRLDQQYFNYSSGLTMTSKKFVELFGHPVRRPETDELTQFHMDVVSSAQAVTEEVVLRMTRYLAKMYQIRNLCLAGGVALNCVANGMILRDKSFDNVWIQPAAGDAGGALGAALSVWYGELDNPRIPNPDDSMKGGYLGPAYEDEQVERRIRNCGGIYEIYGEEEVIDRTTEALVKGKAVGWFQGRMEFGPRALGNRSILGDPRSESMQRTLNLRVKYRESFRPFAPSIMLEDVSAWFEMDEESPYMLFVDKVKEDRRRDMTREEQDLFGIDKLNVKRSDIPAVTHVDYSARIQTVKESTNPKYYQLLKSFKLRTGCPVLVNTSFNVRGEPIVCSPEDAFNCFMGTDIELLVIGNLILRKEDQDPALRQDYRSKYALD